MSATQAELEKSRKELSDTLTAIKTQGSANEAAITAINAQLTKVNQTIDALNRQAMDAKVGPDGESAVYTYVDKGDIEMYPEAYVKNDGGAVQLWGHPDTKGEGWMFGLADDPDPQDEKQLRLQKAVDRRSWVRRILAKARGVKPEEVATPRLDRQLKAAAAAMPGVVAKIFANSANIGLEFHPTRTSPEFEREVRARLGIMSMFPVNDHPGGTVQLPYLSGNLQAFAHSIPTTDDPTNDPLSSLATGADTSVTVTDLVIGAQVHRNATEDAVIAILDQLRVDMADGMVFADDNCGINGHTAGTQDTLASWNVRGRLGVMTNDVKHQLRRFDGLRRKALAGGASSSATLNASQDLAGIRTLFNMLGVEQLMDSLGGSRVVILMNPEWFFKKGIALADFDTWNDVGALAAVLTGRLGPDSPVALPNQVGFLYGRFPVCLCYTLTKDLNASGVYDNTTTDRTGMLAVDRTRYEQWLRKGMTVETDVEIRNNTVTVVGRKRNHFRTKRLGTGQYVATYGYNLTL